VTSLSLAATRQYARDRWHDPVQRSGLFVVMTTSVTSLLGFVYWLVAAQTLEPAAVGLAATTLSAMTLASFASNLGANSALLQLLPPVAARVRSELLAAILSLGIVAGAAGGVLAVAFLALDDGTRLDPAQSGLLVVGVMAQTAQICLGHSWLALRRGGVMLAFESAFAVGKLAALPLVAPFGTTGLLLGWVGSSVVVCVVSLVLLRVLEQVSFALANVRQRLREARSVLAGNHLVNIGGMAPVYLLPVIVAARLGQAEAAYFYAAWQIGSFFYVVASSSASALQAEGARDPAALMAHMRRATVVSCLVLVPLGLFVAAIGHPLLSFYGPGYERAYLLLVCMALAAQPDVVTNLYSAVLRSTRRFRACIGLSWSSATLKLGLTWLLLTPLGLSAAGVAFLIAQLVLSVWCIRDGRRFNAAALAEAGHAA
jgi:O-antigen/teichoic acid export membrane protein